MKRTQRVTFGGRTKLGVQRRDIGGHDHDDPCGGLPKPLPNQKKVGDLAEKSRFRQGCPSANSLATSPKNPYRQRVIENEWADMGTDEGSSFHYRTKDHVEVDAVLEAADGRLVGVEVKAGEAVNKSDLQAFVICNLVQASVFILV